MDWRVLEDSLAQNGIVEDVDQVEDLFVVTIGGQHQDVLVVEGELGMCDTDAVLQGEGVQAHQWTDVPHHYFGVDLVRPCHQVPFVIWHADRLNFRRNALSVVNVQIQELLLQKLVVHIQQRVFLLLLAVVQLHLLLVLVEVSDYQVASGYVDHPVIKIIQQIVSTILSLPPYAVL